MFLSETKLKDWEMGNIKIRWEWRMWWLLVVMGKVENERGCGFNMKSGCRGKCEVLFSKPY